MLEKPTALPVDFNAIPMDLKKIPRFLLWKYTLIGEEGEQRWAKTPYQPNGKWASSTNPDTWTDFLTAQQAYETGNFSGIGFVFTSDDNLVGIDIDDCRDIESGELNDLAQNILDNVEGYCEVSPSGTGIKIFTRANLDTAYVNHEIGFEYYPKSRFFTVTGNYLRGSIPAEVQDLSAHVPERL